MPPVAISYWSFRIMVGAAFFMLLIAGISLYFMLRNRIEQAIPLLKLLPFLIALPYLANTAGWLLTELGRQPWIVFGLQLTADGVSNTVGAGMVAASLLVYSLVYLALIGATIYLLAKYARFDQAEPELDLLPAS